MRTDDLDYDLPERLIAQTPAEHRDAARLMLVHLDAAPPGTPGSAPAPANTFRGGGTSGGGGGVEHRTVAELPTLLRPGDLLVMNDTKVLPARFHGVRGGTGGRVEGLFIETRDDRVWHVMLRSGGKLRPGEKVRLTEHDHLELIEQRGDGSWIVVKHSEWDTPSLLDRVGSMPLPPYIRRLRSEDDQLDSFDRQRYQTVYAREPGAVAAPTAGLHFTQPLLDELTAAGVRTARLTLHVGPGTFAPVRAATLEEHEMHAERFTVPAATLEALRQARAQGRRIIPVGTTTVRALESLPEELNSSTDYTTETRLLIQPGFTFRYTDGMMTNFHLPRSTLLALVAARTGLDRLRELYRVAVEREYRFYSYGDAMLLLP